MDRRKFQYTHKHANIRHYHPDFVVKLKDEAAKNWCENASKLTDTKWNYLKVLQKDYNELHPHGFSELEAALITPKLI